MLKQQRRMLKQLAGVPSALNRVQAISNGPAHTSKSAVHTPEQGAGFPCRSGV